MKKLLIYYNFIVVSLLVFAGFAGVQDYTQLAASALFYPLFVYFALLVVPTTSKSIKIIKEIEEKGVEPLLIRGSTPDSLEAKPLPFRLDADRRSFLKIIGSAGVTVFFYALFSNRAEAAFFGSVPGPGTVALKDIAGNKIDPAEKQPTDGYKSARLDDSTPAYYGFINKDGAWFIMREESDGTYKYQRASSNFLTTGWNIRNTTLQYFDFDSIF